MRMYIANGTKQVINFLYRLPEQNGVRSQNIPIGGQIALSDDLRREDIDYILSQHTRYGLLPVEEVKNPKTFVGMCYSIDKPVKIDSIEMLMTSNNDRLVERGREIRKEAAVASSAGIENEIAEKAPGGFNLRNMEMEIIEENPERNQTTRPVAEGYRVSRDDEPSPSGNRAARRANRR